MVGGLLEMHSTEMAHRHCTPLTPLPLEGQYVSLALQPLRSDESLDLRCLGARLLAFLAGDGPPDDVLPHVILLAQVVELPDLSDPLWAEPTRNRVVREPRDVALALLHDDEVEHAQVAVNNAAANRLAPPLALATGTETGVALGEEELDTAICEYALLHGEALLVIAPRDSHHIALRMNGGGGREERLGGERWLQFFAEELQPLCALQFQCFPPYPPSSPSTHRQGSPRPTPRRFAFRRMVACESKTQPRLIKLDAAPHIESGPLIRTYDVDMQVTVRYDGSSISFVISVLYK